MLKHYGKQPGKVEEVKILLLRSPPRGRVSCYAIQDGFCIEDHREGRRNILYATVMKRLATNAAIQ